MIRICGTINHDWLEDERLYVYVSQAEDLAAFTDFFMNRFATK